MVEIALESDPVGKVPPSEIMAHVAHNRNQ